MHKLKETVKTGSGKQDTDSYNENRDFQLSFPAFTIKQNFKHTKCSMQEAGLITDLWSNDSKFAIYTFSALDKNQIS